MKESSLKKERKNPFPYKIESLKGARVSILSGLLEGASLNIKKNSFVIGSSPEADIVLVDDGIAIEHALITISKSMLGTAVSVKALAEEVVCNDQTVSIESIVTSRGILNLTLAGIELQIAECTNTKIGKNSINKEEVYSTETKETSEKYVAKKKVFGNRITVLLVTILSIFCYGLAFYMSSQSEEAVEREFRDIKKEQVKELKPGEFLAKLRDVISAGGLKDQVSVKMKNKDSIQVIGVIRKGYVSKWETVLEWYDSYPNAPLLISDVTEQKEGRSLPSIALVWYGLEPYAIFSSGKKYRVGDIADSGWKVESISRDSITVVRSDDRVKIGFN